MTGTLAFKQTHTKIGSGHVVHKERNHITVHITQRHGGHLALPVQNYLQPVQRQTRRSHSGAYIEYQSRLDCFKFSFVPQTTRDLNNLPPSISNITDSDQFKSAVTNYLQARDKNILD